VSSAPQRVLFAALWISGAAALLPLAAAATERHPMHSGLTSARAGFPTATAASAADERASAVEEEARRLAALSATASAAAHSADDALRETLARAVDSARHFSAPEATFEERRGTLLLPIYYRPIARFGDRRDPRTGTSERHTGWSWSRTGEVVAATDGVVVRTALASGWGALVVVSHGDAAHTIYAQLSHVSVERGDVVARGDAIGAVDAVYGDRSTLYFELRLHGIPVDPAAWWRL
jgi:septal ring factor EnvC (AmiA/AmiB activator)